MFYLHKTMCIAFSDGGKYNSIDRAVIHAKQMIEDGAHILDIGGESTRPGAEKVSLDEELSRVIPVIEKLVQEIDVPISVDTYKAKVADEALKAIWAPSSIICFA